MYPKLSVLASLRGISPAGWFVTGVCRIQYFPSELKSINFVAELPKGIKNLYSNCFSFAA